MDSSSPKYRLVPHKLLTFMLYAEDSTWIEPLGDWKVRITTSKCSKFMRMRIAQVWEQLYWLEKTKMILKVEKERKIGTAIIHLRPVNRELNNETSREDRESTSSKDIPGTPDSGQSSAEDGR